MASAVRRGRWVDGISVENAPVRLRNSIRNLSASVRLQIGDAKLDGLEKEAVIME